MLAAVLLFSSLALLDASPVVVSIASDNSGSLHLGPYDRTRFDLVEEFHPLATATAARGAVLRAAGVKNIQDKDIDGKIELENREKSSERVAAPSGHWLEWTSWGACVNGERSRYRACVSFRAGRRDACKGESKQTEKCNVVVPEEAHRSQFTEDPWTIEKEIVTGIEDAIANEDQ